ncbi:MAG: hypothetical protein ACM3MI_03825 [Clostridiales bacterium]
MAKENITYCGIKLEVEYSYSPEEGDGWDTPHYNEYVEIDNVFHAEENITNLFIEKQVDELADIILEIIKEYRTEMKLSA